MEVYTGMYVVDPTLTQQELEDVSQEINNLFINCDLKSYESTYLGIYDLPYEINNFTKGHYMKIVVKANQQAISNYDNYCKDNKHILRYILSKNE